MGYEHTPRTVTDEDRREFLKVLGVTGAATAGGVTLSEIREEMSAGTADELAPIGESIKADLAGTLDAELIASQQDEFVEHANTIPAVIEKGLPTDGVRNDFGAVAEAGYPVYDHLTEIGFFDSTARHIPQFTPAYLESSVQQLIASEALAEPIAAIGFDEQAVVDFIAPVINHRDRLSRQLWLTTEQVPQEGLGKYIPPMTQQAAGGVLLWLQDIDQHLWQDRVLLTDEVLADLTWDAHAMAAGFGLMTEGAKIIASENGAPTESELAALLTSGFALQRIAQTLLPMDGYWITEEMRGERRTDLEAVTKDLETIKSEIIGGV